MPRLFSVQATGCAPVVKAFECGLERCEPWSDPHTVAVGLLVPGPLGGILMLRALRESGGGAVAVTDEALVAAQHLLSSLEGVDACPEGGRPWLCCGSSSSRGDWRLTSGLSS